MISRSHLRQRPRNETVLNQASWFVLPVLLMFASYSAAKPKHFVAAIQFGATDCSFCHTTVAGGEAVNERGAWLIEQKIKRNVLEVDVNWLTELGEVADESRELTTTAETAAVVADVEQTESSLTTRKPFDYSTNWGEWPSYNGNLQAQKYSPLPHINQQTIDRLELAWIWEAEIDAGLLATRSEGLTRRARRRAGPDTMKATPLVVNGTVYVRTRLSTVVAIDAITGAQKWEFDPGTRNGPQPAMFGWTTRGLGYHKQSTCDEESPCERVIVLASDGWMFALDADTGTPIESFGTEGKVDLTQGLRRPLERRQVAWSHPPLVCNDVVVVGSQTNDMSQFQFRGENWNQNLPLGDVRGFDPVTGEQLWVFKTVPQEGEVGVDTWGKESWRWMGNTNVWSTFSCDPELNHVYLPVTAPTNHMYGGDRLGDNLFGDSVVAVDLSSGERQWHFQITRHDIWDYDLPAAPVVADIVVDDKPRKVVAQVTKVGYLFVLDRITGEPIWPVEEHEVPASTVEGEVAAATQPHPTKPPPFELQGIKEEYLNDLTPELLESAKEMIASFKTGPLYTPVSIEGTVLSPGIGGGANWTGASFDPVDHQLFVPSRREPMAAHVIPIDKESWGFPYRERWYPLRIDGLPILRPPWSNITAYDLDKGEIAWQVANGAGPKDHPSLQSVKTPLPDLGRLSEVAGILVLPDLLLMGHAGSPSTIKALRKSDGSEVWSASLTGYFGSPAPATYTASGKQYVVVATGSSLEPSRISAFALDISTTED